MSPVSSRKSQHRSMLSHELCQLMESCWTDHSNNRKHNSHLTENPSTDESKSLQLPPLIFRMQESYINTCNQTANVRVTLQWGAFMEPLLQKKNNKHYIFRVFVALSTQNAIPATLSSVASQALQYFSTLSHKWCNFQKKLLNTKCVFWFSLQILHETVLILKRTEQDKNQICTLVFKWSAHYSWLSLMTREFARETFEKYSNSKFHENPTSGSRAVPCGQRQTLQS
jgi:hypothetical protein